MILFDTHINSLEEVGRYLGTQSGSGPLVDATSEVRVGWIEMTLERFRYDALSKTDKGLIRQYIQAVTGYSRAQIDRHIHAYSVGWKARRKSMGGVVRRRDNRE